MSMITKTVNAEKPKITLLQLINLLAVFIVFSDALSWPGILPFMEIRLSYFLIVFLCFLSIPFLKGIYFSKTFLFFFGAIVLFSLYNIFLAKDTLFLLSKQLMGIFLNALFFYLIVKINKYDVKKLFKIYLNFAVLAGVIGLFQELSYLLGFRTGYDFSYILASRVHISQTGLLKVSSIMSEPAAFCYVMIPAFFTAITSFKKNEFKFLNKCTSSIIILSVIFSFSLSGYAGISFSFILLFFNYAKMKHFLIGTVVLSILMFFAYDNVMDLKMRINDSVGALIGKTKLEETNKSTFTLYCNTLIAWESIKDSPLFGSGLGSHAISYERYLNEVVDVKNVNPKFLFQNSRDTSSLLIRIMSETGLVGLLSVFYFIFRFWTLKKNDSSNYLWVVNNAILTMFFVRAIRGGHYFVGGTFFFMWMYYFSGKLSNSNSYHPLSLAAKNSGEVECV